MMLLKPTRATSFSRVTALLLEGKAIFFIYKVCLEQRKCITRQTVETVFLNYNILPKVVSHSQTIKKDIPSYYQGKQGLCSLLIKLSLPEFTGCYHVLLLFTTSAGTTIQAAYFGVTSSDGGISNINNASVTIRPENLPLTNTHPRIWPLSRMIPVCGPTSTRFVFSAIL